ncbi:MAG TPA: urate hydroxylase PuuD [Terriglobales bacterium]|nr:urate hydroxylase PuuD [Terriglobales bacterium]
MTNVAAVAAFYVTGLMIPADANATVQVFLRWIHLFAGITWVGLLYFFNLVSVPFMKELEAGTRSRVYPGLMSRALWWFRWSSVVTVLMGFGYWNMIVAADARNARAAGIDASGGAAIWTFLVIWTLAFMIEMGVLMSPAEGLKKGPVLGIVVAIVVVGASYAYVALNSHGWESNRLLSIGIGGGMGWFMMFNVWGLIWRMQKKMLRWTSDSAQNGTPLPAEAAKFARLTFLVSRVNFFLSFPMLFFMAAASHYPFLVQ